MPRNIKKDFQGNLDDSIPEIVENELIRVCTDESNASDFLLKFKKLIANYRYWRNVRKNIPTTSANIKHLEKILTNIETLRNNIDLISIDATAYLDEAYYSRFKDNFFSLQERLDSDLNTLNWAINNGLGRFEYFTPKKGEKPKNLEHQLLADVSNLIYHNTSFKKISSAGSATILLSRCGVHGIPNDPNKARAIVIKFQNNP